MLDGPGRESSRPTSVRGGSEVSGGESIAVTFLLLVCQGTFVALIAMSSLSSSVCVGSGFAEVFLGLALDRSGMGSWSSKSSPASMLRGRDFGRLGVVTTADFFDLVVFELTEIS